MIRTLLSTTLLLFCYATSAAALQVILTKDTYGPTELIEILVYNDTNDYITITQPGSIWAINLETGEIYSFISLAIVYPFPYIGWSHTIPLRKAFEMPVGDYEIVVRYVIDYDNANPAYESVFISLAVPVGRQRESVGQLKTKY